MEKTRFCKVCEGPIESGSEDVICKNCLDQAKRKTKPCLSCGSLIENEESRYFCSRCEGTGRAGPKAADASRIKKPKSRKQKRILIVDDEENVVEVIKARLQSEDFETLTAYDGEEGYDKIKDEKPDLIILDIMMPHMTGYDLLKRLRSETDGTEKIPVVILTAKAQMKEFFSDWDINDFMVKPFTAEELLKKVREHLWLADRIRERETPNPKGIEEEQ